MGYFYFDESIQERGGFIIGAYVYSVDNLTPKVFSILRKSGFHPGIDEFKSGSRMQNNPKLNKLRQRLSSILVSVKCGVIVAPAYLRERFGDEAIKGLQKFIQANSLSDQVHHVYLDEGINISLNVQNSFLKRNPNCTLNIYQDSKLVGGLQVADLIAHTSGIMLMDQLGLVTKKVKPEEKSGYAPDMEIELGFSLWTSLRPSFFKSPHPKPGSIPEDPVGDQMYDVENLGLHISLSCSKQLQDAALDRFGECYMGCIH